MICETCKKECGITHNKECTDCYNINQSIWEKRRAIRQDAKQFDSQNLVNLLLNYHWQHECEINPCYLPPNPRPDTKPECQIHYKNKYGMYSGLRYSKGPRQGYFWDVYGDDFYTPELALIALSKAPPPHSADILFPTND